MLADIDAYIDRLRGYRQGDVDGLVRYVASACATASEEAERSAIALAGLPDKWRQTVKPRRSSTADSLIDRLLDIPVLTDKTAAAAAGSSVRRAYTALDQLTDAHVLTEITGNKRDRVWMATDVLDEIDRLHSRIGHRVKPTGI